MTAWLFRFRLFSHRLEMRNGASVRDEKMRKRKWDTTIREHLKRVV